MEFQNIFPFWEQLNEKEREIVSEGVASQKMKKGDILHRGCGECSGIVHVAQGQLRVYIVSEEGREVTLYRLHQGELCVLSASCLMDAIVFDVLIEAVQDSELVVLPSPVLSTVMHGNPLVELSLYKRVVENFSDVMWTMQQILFMGADKRVAHFLWDEMAKTGDPEEMWFRARAGSTMSRSEICSPITGTISGTAGSARPAETFLPS